jgi:hypothetical protein
VQRKISTTWSGIKFNVFTDSVNDRMNSDRMSSDRIPKLILKYQPKGKRNLGRPLKRWKDSVL